MLVDHGTSKYSHIPLGEHFCGLRLFRRLREVAPNIRPVIRDIDPVDEIMGLSRTLRLDLAVHHARFDGTTLEQSTFMSFQAVLIAREGHPRVYSAVGSMERLLEERTVGWFLTATQAGKSRLKTAPTAVEFSWLRM